MPELRANIRHKVAYGKVEGEKTFRSYDNPIPIWIEGSGSVAIYVGQDKDDMQPNAENPYTEADTNLFLCGADYVSYLVVSGSPKVIVPKNCLEIVSEDVELIPSDELPDYLKKFRVET